MATKSLDEVLEVVKQWSVVELAQFIKKVEEEFGVSAAAPVAAVAATPMAGGETAAAAEEKSEFKVTLKDAGAEKIKVIKALRAAVSTLSLKDAKDMVESAPCVVAEASPKDDAKKIKEILEAAGAKVELS